MRTDRIGKYAIVIGAMKSGTTTLHAMLSEHPQIAPSVPKEANFFSAENFVPSIEVYENSFSLNGDQHVYRLDSSTNYSKFPRWSSVPRRISSFPGTKKLIYILRNPIDRIDSHIAHNINRGRLKTGVRDLVSNNMISVSSYAMQIKRYEEVGLLQEMLLLDFAELCKNPQSVADKVTDFLALPRFTPRATSALNTRAINGSFLSEKGREYCRIALRPDVRDLIDLYRFEPAKSWEIL